jgi:hypothetical protein
MVMLLTLMVSAFHVGLCANIATLSIPGASCYSIIPQEIKLFHWSISSYLSEKNVDSKGKY